MSKDFWELPSAATTCATPCLLEDDRPDVVVRWDNGGKRLSIRAVWRCPVLLECTACRYTGLGSAQGAMITCTIISLMMP